MKVKETAMSKSKIEWQDTYAYGFHDEDVSVYRTQKGLSAQVVETISRIKQEMRDVYSPVGRLVIASFDIHRDTLGKYPA